MYIVRDKKTKKVIHINPAPLSQNLKDKEVYSKFDPNKMEIGRIEGDLPDHFDIDEKGKIRELTLLEKVNGGFIDLRPEQKIVNNEIVEKTLSEKVAEGLITISPAQKIIGEGVNEQVVEKTVSEKIADGLITLSSTQKLIGEGEEERIVEKTLSEQNSEGLITLSPDQKIIGAGEMEEIVEKTDAEKVAEGIITLESNQKLVGEEIVKKSTREMLDEGLLTLEEVKKERIQHFSNLALEKRRAIMPDYKLQNASLGIYEKQEIEVIKNTVQKFREDFYRLKKLLEEAKNLDEIESIKENFIDKPLDGGTVL